MISGLGRSITVQRATTTKNNLRESVYTWTDYLTTGAQITQRVRQRDRQEVIREDDHSTVDDVLQATIVYGPLSSTITIADRVVFEGNNYDIQTVNFGAYKRDKITLVLRRRTE